MAKVSILHLNFTPNQWDNRVEEVCESWRGTGYKLNGCKKGWGVDCIHFGAAVLDELYGINNSKNLQSLPPDACVHNKKGVLAAGRALFKAYPTHRKVMDDSIESGDLVILGPISKKPAAAHLRIAGRQGRMWQCTSAGVHFTGYGISENEMLVAIYRATNKVLWC